MSLDPQHEQKRQILRVLGLILMATGGILFVIGILDFFQSFGSLESGPPKRFWMAFVGLLLFGVGTQIAGMGFLGLFTRYGAGEVAPVAKDALQYLKDPSHTSQDLIACPSCGTRNRPDAHFCDSCGSALGVACPACSTRNDADSKFCDNCGKDLSAA